MDELTEQQLLAAVFEIREMARVAARALHDAGHFDEWAEGVRARAEEEAMRGTPLDEVSGMVKEKQALYEAGFTSLEQVAATPPDELAAVKGVGPATMKRLAAELADRGIPYADAS